jgi:hypothetical protein
VADDGLRLIIEEHAPLIRKVLQIGREKAAMSIRADGCSGKPYPNSDLDWMVGSVARQIMEFGPDAVESAWTHANIDWKNGEPAAPLKWLCSPKMVTKFLDGADNKKHGHNPYAKPAKPAGRVSINAPPGTVVRSRNTGDGVHIEIMLPMASMEIDGDTF